MSLTRGPSRRCSHRRRLQPKGPFLPPKRRETLRDTARHRWLRFPTPPPPQAAFLARIAIGTEPKAGTEAEPRRRFGSRHLL